MLENATVARPYASAAFELAQEAGQVSHWSDMLGLLSVIFSDQDMRRLIFNPRISAQQLQDLIFDICGGRLCDAGRNFVNILIQAERLQYAPSIKALFDEMRAKAEGRVDVEVIVAYELDQQQEEAIAKVIANRLGRQVNISTSVDGALIGGAIIRAGDAVIDASLRGRLNELHHQLNL